MGFICLMQVIPQGIKSGTSSFKSELRLLTSFTWMPCASCPKSRKRLMGMTQIFESMWQALSLLMFQKLDLLLIILTLFLRLLINRMCFQSFSFSLKLEAKILLGNSRNKKWKKMMMKKKAHQTKISWKMHLKLKNSNFMKSHLSQEQT